MPIEVNFRYLPGEYLRALCAYQYRRVRLGPDLVVSAMFFCLGAWIVIRLPTYFWLGMIFAALSLVLPVLYLIAFGMAVRAIATNPKLAHEYRLSFSDQEIRFSTEGVESRLDWRFYRSALRKGGFYFLFYGRNQFTLIPERVLREAGQKQAFEALLCEVLPTFEIEM